MLFYMLEKKTVALSVEDRLTHTRAHTHSHTHTSDPLGRTDEREKERSGTESHGAEHTLSYRWTEILMQSQAEVGKCAHTHTLIQKSIFKSIARLFCPCGFDRDTHTQTSCVLDH